MLSTGCIVRVHSYVDIIGVKESPAICRTFGDTGGGASGIWTGGREAAGLDWVT